MENWIILVATYNLKNLFLHGEGVSKHEKEVRPLARMIDQVGADVMAVQEVGSVESLATLNARLAHPYPFCAVLPGNSNRSIHLGLLARRQFTFTTHQDLLLSDVEGTPLQYFRSAAAAKSVQRSALGFQRDLLLAETQVSPHQRLALFCVHLKSRTNQPWQMLAADTMRAAECRAMRRIVASYAHQYPATLICLLGDFNDRLSSDALSPLAELPFTDPLGNLLRRSGRNPSTYWPKRRMRIDHILIAQNTLPTLVPDSPKIHVSDMARTASDHYPVSIELNLADLPDYSG